MIFNMVGGSGGLNFEVVGGTTQPTSPKENTIWVNTSTAITSWVISPSQPTGAAGMVWIASGTNGLVNFNALKKNTIQLYTLSAKQYVSGAWVNKDVKIYQGGAWSILWNGELFLNGEQYTDITGGWSFSGYSHSAIPNMTAGSVSSGKIVLNGNTKLVGTQKAVDVTNYDLLTIKGNIITSTGECLTATVAKQKASFNASSAASGSVYTVGSFTKEIPLSGVSGNVYIALYTQGGGGTNNAEITSVTLS